MPNRIIRLRTVLDRTGLSRSTLYRKIGEGSFPPQLKISVHGAGWSEAEVERWIADPAGWQAPNNPTSDRKEDGKTNASRT